MRKIILLFLVLLFSCGTFQRMSENNRKNYVPYDSLISYMEKDTVKYKPSNAEKAGLVLFTLFVIHAVSSDMEKND